MIELVKQFIAQKNLSTNSQTAYNYDLQQFLDITEEKITDSKLLLYKNFLSTLKPTAQKRKISAVNQFLYYLYENSQVDKFHKLTISAAPEQKTVVAELVDLSCLTNEVVHVAGQLIALLISEFGLTPSEIMKLKTQDFDLDFQILTVTKGQSKRILQIPKYLNPYLTKFMYGDFLFDNAGKAYSRQWYFNQLTNFLTEVALTDLTAQKLREQYIIKEIKAGKSLSEIAKNLGLKSIITLEKYV